MFEAYPCMDSICDSEKLGGGFKYLLFSPLFGEDSQFDYIIFFRWVETTNQITSSNEQ